jgi:nicotinamide mononucleotide transporter
MDVSPIFNQFLQNLINTSSLELIAVVTGMASVWFARKENILVYPTGIISVLIYVYLCFFAKLYADMGINFFYFIMSVYGWYMWTRKGKILNTLQISQSGRKGQLLYVLAGIVIFLILGFILLNYTDSDVPLWDSFTTAVFIIAMWLMARKKIEHWAAWTIGNLVSIPLYFYKGMVFTSFQYMVFLILAILGYLEWEKRLKSRPVKVSVNG